MKQRYLQFDNGDIVKLDGKLQTLLQALYQQISLKNEMVYTTRQLADSVKMLVAQMNEDERTAYLIQSIIVSFTFFDRELIKKAYEEKRAQHVNDKPA